MKIFLITWLQQKTGMSGNCAGSSRSTFYPAFRCRGPRMTLNFKSEMRPVLPKKNDAWYSSCFFFSKALPTHRFHPQFSRLQDAVCEKLAVSQSQFVICFRQPWSPGFGMHSRGGDGCCFWDDDYVLVLFCLDTVSYFWFHSKKNTVKKKHHPDRKIGGWNYILW